MDWSTKKFHYKIIDQSGKVIGTVYKLLTELEDFAIKSGLAIKRLERKGPNDFIVEVKKNHDWKI